MVVERNEPCPCGSGLKYKKCHGTTSKAPVPWASGHFFELPVEKITEPTSTVMTSNDGGQTWAEVPGARPFFSITYADDRYTNDKIENLSSTLNNVLGTGKFALCQNQIHKVLQEVKHKLYAVHYHLTELLNEEKNAEDIIRREKMIPDGPYTEQDNDKMIYELEGLLFQTKACLDRIARILNPTFKFNLNGFDAKGTQVGGGVLIAFERNCPKELIHLAAELSSILKRHIQGWIEEAVEYRNDITHYRQLDGLFCFVHEPNSGNSTIKVFYPVMPNRMRMTDYAEKTFNSLMSFTERFLTKLFEK